MSSLKDKIIEEFLEREQTKLLRPKSPKRTRKGPFMIPSIIKRRLEDEEEEEY